jgi:hypothetical protein
MKPLFLILLFASCATEQTDYRSPELLDEYNKQYKETVERHIKQYRYNHDLIKYKWIPKDFLVTIPKYQTLEQ